MKSKARAGKARKTAPERNLDDLAMIRRLLKRVNLPDSRMVVTYEHYSFKFKRVYDLVGFSNPYGTTKTAYYFMISAGMWAEMKERYDDKQITETFRQEIAAQEAEYAADAGVAIASGIGRSAGDAGRSGDDKSRPVGATDPD